MGIIISIFVFIVAAGCVVKFIEWLEEIISKRKH